MGNCHYCMNCGRCRGEKPPAILVRRCPSCGHVNEPGSNACADCGASLALQTGGEGLAPGAVLRKRR
ncbi:zinc ribbon domain-containing protein [Gordonibacter sp. 28C]|uniref:zinc ribbon domain-containing protein n=1 Tax=Gordonibacter sp. 28C TaxID=2078569 RepID=UPI001314721F|nr:zinc ribbon domain-containing protein [Gordonibacter sp. 28C]